MRLDLGDFGSRVAQRVFLLFLACALLPSGVVGLFAWSRSSAELERGARAQLHRDARNEGLALLSRLLVADGLLRSLGDDASTARLNAMPWLGVERARAESLPGGAPTAAEGKALASGRSLLRRLDAERLVHVHAPDPARARLLLAAELEPDYLWTYDTHDADSGLTIVDAAGRAIYSSLPDAEARSAAAAALPERFADDAAPRGAEAPIAEPWLLFLASRFEAPSWYVVRSQSRALTFAALAEFQAIFRWSLLLALLVVTALSSVQIRRQLQPLQALARAAERLGEGHFDTRAAIDAGNEFGALGRAFDGMASRIERHVQALASASAVGVALSAEEDETRLAALVTRALVDSTSCGAAAFLRPRPGGGLEVVAATGALVDAADEAREAALTGRTVLRGASGRGATACIALPLFDHESRVLGVLVAAQPTDEHGAPLPAFRDSDVVAARSLASQAAVALTNRALVDEFRTLFEGLINLTVTALDEKSAYTGGHCRRVPIITELFADAVCRTREGAFADFTFTTAQRYELRIAALLHDFGKVVTPVHVMDKSTKLETIHDGIEGIAARYAVLLAEARGEGAERPPAAVLREELAFLRACNVGAEAMSEAHQQRVREIAARRRWRDLDGRSRPVLDDEEIENLTVSRGTLNARERKVIEEHAELTIRLLEQLPFPPRLAAVPQIAGSHHEQIDGRGYPLGLAGAEITVQGRLLGIADVFEALTAPDRPYRRPWTVSKAVGTLREMVKRGKLDADLFEVFVREGVHLRYAREHLRPEQLDDATLDALARLPGGPLPA